MTSLDDGTDDWTGDGPGDEAGVTIRCVDNAAVGVRLSGKEPFGEGCVRYAVEVWAPGLTARAEGVVAWVRDADLAAFVAGLAAGFQGWEGERVWQTCDGDVAVSAAFRAGGHVGLTWALRPWPKAAGGWAASVTTWVEAGEQMSSLASAVEGFFCGE